METHIGYLDKLKLLDKGEIVINFHIKNMFGRYIDVNRMGLTFCFNDVDNIYDDKHKEDFEIENIKDCEFFQMARLDYCVSDFGVFFKTNNESLKNQIFDGDHVMEILLHELGHINIIVKYKPNIRKLKLLKLKEKLREKLSIKNN